MCLKQFYQQNLKKIEFERKDIYNILKLGYAFENKKTININVQKLKNYT
jgi:hypothetical protein